jgi:MFS family permease
MVCVGLAMALNTLFLNFYLQALGFSQQLIGLINGLPTATLVVAGLPVGRLIDRRGPRLGLVVGGLAAAGASLGIAVSSTPPAVVASTVLLGVGSAFGFISVAPYQMANSTDRERVALFSAQAALLTGTGFLGNLIGGQLPGLFGPWLRAPSDSLIVLRATMLIVSVMWAAGVLPMLAAREPSPVTITRPAGRPEDPGEAPRRLVSDPRTVLKLLVPSFLVSLGAGQTIPFLNIYISGRFGVAYASLGTLFAVGALGTTAATLAQPVLADRYGRIRSVLIVQIGSIPFLVMLGFSPIFSLVAVSFVVRVALMNMGNPVYQAFAQGLIPPREQATYSSLATVAWSLAWSLGAAFSGWWRGRVEFAEGFNTVFALMTLLYIAAMGLTYLFFVRNSPPERDAARV